MDFFVFLVAIFSVILNAGAQLAIKWGVSGRSGHFSSEGTVVFVVSILTNPGILIGLSLYVISVGIWMYVLSKIDVSVAYPLLSIGYVINVFMAAFLFNEPLSLNKIIGIGLIIFGVVVLYRGAQS
jgi:multidrug transporter EmrE-like cation transporter